MDKYDARFFVFFIIAVIMIIWTAHESALVRSDSARVAHLETVIKIQNDYLQSLSTELQNYKSK